MGQLLRAKPGCSAAETGDQMFESGILDVAIGLVFVFLLVSLLCSAVREGIESWTKTRAAYLEYGIRGLLHDLGGTGLAGKFYNHPLIYGLYAEPYTPGRVEPRPGLLTRGKNLPSYIPARNFALALLDMAARGPQTDGTSSNPGAPVLSLASVRANVLLLQNEAVQRVLLTAIDSAQGDLERAVASLEAWYDSGMERVAGWYKRSTQWIIFWIALFVAIAGNIDTLAIANYLYRNDAARAVLVERASAAVADAAALERSYQQSQQALAELQLPIGWGAAAPAKTASAGAARPTHIGSLVAALVGWMLTALAATLGAPFWFDVLQRVMVIRNTVKPRREGAAPQPTAPSPLGAIVVPASAGGLAAAFAAPPSAHDPTTDIDGCDPRPNGHNEQTPDEQLPAATGGVARA